MRKLVALLVAATAMLTAAMTAYGVEMNLIYDEIYHYYNEEDVFIEINGKRIETPDMPPVILNDRTLVPVREVFEAVGADVEWDNKAKKASIEYEGVSVIFTIGSRTVNLGRSKYIIADTDPAPMIINDKTMIPVRTAANLLGFDVNWDNSRRTVELTDLSGEASKPSESETSGETEKTDGQDADFPSNESVIGKIYCTKSADGADLIYLAYENPVEPEISRYSNPQRVVMDFDGTSLSADGSTEFEGTVITSVRSANHEDSARIVLDVKKQPDIEVRKSPTGIVIIVRSSEGKGSTQIYDLIDGDVYEPPKESEVQSGAQTGNQTDTQTDTQTEQTNPSGGSLITLDTSGTVDSTTATDFDYNTIVIDAGHGGSDPGALGGNAKESEINLSISKKVTAKLEAAGYTVVQTRPDDTHTTLQARVDTASVKRDGKIAALFVSIHCNSFDREDVNGTQVYYHPDSKYGTILAQNIYNANVSGTSLNPGQIHDGSHLFVIRKTIQPAALVETAFISNDSDRAYLTSDEGQEALAQGIFEGIVKTVEQMKSDKGL